MYSTLSRPLQPSCAVKCCTPSTNICRYVCCYSSPPCPVARPKPGLCIGLTNSGTSPPLVASQHRTAHCDRVNAKQSLCMRSTAGVQQRQAQTSGAGSKSFTYTAYEGNSWQITLDQSGQQVLRVMVLTCRTWHKQTWTVLKVSVCRRNCSGRPLAGRGPCLCKPDVALQGQEGSIE